MWPNLQFPVNLVPLIEEILSRKLHVFIQCVNFWGASYLLKYDQYDHWKKSMVIKNFFEYSILNYIIPDSIIELLNKSLVQGYCGFN